MNKLRLLDHFPARWLGPNQLMLFAVGVLVAGGAIVVGTLVGQEDWAYLAALAGLIVACVWPMQTEIRAERNSLPRFPRTWNCAMACCGPCAGSAK